MWHMRDMRYGMRHVLRYHSMRRLFTFERHETGEEGSDDGAEHNDDLAPPSTRQISTKHQKQCRR